VSKEQEVVVTLSIRAVLATAALVALWLPQARADGEDDPAAQTGSAALTAPEGGPQPLAGGCIEVEKKDTGQEFEVEVRNVDAAVALTVLIDDGTGTFVSIGPLEAGATERELELNTAEGDALPAGALTVEDLAGRTVQVRDGADAVVLSGTVPALGTHACEDGDDGDDDDQGEAEPARARAALMRDAASPDADASGCIKVEKEPGEESLEIRVAHLDAGLAIEFFLEDAGGAMVSVGTAAVDDEGGAEIEFSTEDGGTLPLGAASVDDLAGRRVEVKTADGTLLLFGQVPAATTSASRTLARATLKDTDSAARVKIRARIDARAGRERLRIDVMRLMTGGADAELWMDDGSGTPALAGTSRVNHGGRARFQWDTRRGQGLPFGVETLRDLSGRAFEIRVDGTAAMSGNLPAF
jgi:hypothetical protein